MEANLYHNHIPSFGGNLTVAIIFSILVVLQILFGLYFKQKRLLWLLAAGTITETIGYAGRVWASKAPDNSQPYIMEMVCISIGPGFLLSALYYLIAQLVIVFGQPLLGMNLDFFKVGLDSFNLIYTALIGAGIGVAASANTEAVAQRGINCLIAGFSFQLAAMVFSQGLWYSFLYRTWKRISSQGGANLNETHEHIKKGKYFILYCFSISLCFVFITIRTCYRIAEYSEGWIHSPIFYTEIYSMILEALMILLTSILLTCFHPGLVYGKDGLNEIDKSMKLFRKGSATVPNMKSFFNEHKTPNLANSENPTPILDHSTRNPTAKDENYYEEDFNIPLPIINLTIRIVRYFMH